MLCGKLQSLRGPYVALALLPLTYAPALLCAPFRALQFHASCHGDVPSGVVNSFGCSACSDALMTDPADPNSYLYSMQAQDLASESSAALNEKI